VERTRVEHHDPARPRVTKWSRCESAACRRLTPTYQIEVDHIDPVIPVDQHFEDMSLDVVRDRLWCDESNLQGICEKCHDEKTNAEREARKPFAKPRRPRKKVLR
jgi:5-methylcytosine-specific restriction endonuclease McrA